MAVIDAARESRVGEPQPTAAGVAITVVVPTRNEAGNVATLVTALELVARTVPLDVIFVDDSDDDTPAIVEQVAAGATVPVQLIHRPPGERDGGLGGAVIAGFRAASAPWVCVMDGDLQHPPSLIPEMFARALADDLDLVSASRFRAASGRPGLSRLRQRCSSLLISLARVGFPLKLRNVTDPLTGFFLVRRERLRLNELHPRGFKILLEILVRTSGLRVGEVPFTFGARHTGESKASAQEAWNYLRQVVGLRLGSFSRFALVGATGLVINIAAMIVALHAGAHYLLAALLATQASSAWNFVLTELWVFRGRTFKRNLAVRAGSFFAMNNASLLVRGPIIFLLRAGLGLNPVLANVASLAAVTVSRFSLSDTWIWTGAREVPRRHLYSIHGLVTIDSPTRLPELVRFSVDELSASAMILIEHGRVGASERGVTIDGDTVVYSEGRAGFAARVEMSTQIRITASPLLRYSPHVLYTNVVEPILRWRLVELDYALVHAACVGFGRSAFLITARTDTGKTTTILKLLDRDARFRFISDDLTLLTPAGRVLTYPKPLTISRHTVSSVKTPLLSLKERLGLVVQSRLHSKSGRMLGLLMARIGVRAATLNAIVQWLVPPPKYGIDRLVPAAEVQPRAELGGIVVIQRSNREHVSELDDTDALAILLENCDDAYTFPPYPLIEDFLHSRGGTDLRAAESAIVGRALAGRTAALIESEQREWWRHIEEVALRSAPNGDLERRSQVADRRAGRGRAMGAERRAHDDRRGSLAAFTRADPLVLAEAVA